MVIGVYALIEDLSWSLFNTFILKENHGFNKMTLGLFFADQFKSVILTVILGGGVYYGIMRII
jgi:STE24 endopeptidase